MKLLFDENLAPDLVQQLDDIFPESTHVRDLGLKSAPDSILWEFAARRGYTIVTRDADFRQRSFLYGQPPKVIWICAGNCSTSLIADILRRHRNDIEMFHAAVELTFLRLA